MKHIRTGLGIFVVCLGVSAGHVTYADDIPTATVAVSTPSYPPIRAIHVTAWLAGSTKYRHYVDQLLKDTVINAVAIDIKEFQGEVFVPGVAAVQQANAYVRAIPDLSEWLADLKKRGVYTIARQVVFKDNIMPRKRPDLGVHNHLGELWYDRNHITWLDPYNKEARRYNLLIALQAARLGFEEIQFDYIRFPTDGNLNAIRYKATTSRSDALLEFLDEARRLLHPLGIKTSIDLFGLTTSVNTGMGIGQMMVSMTEKVDYVCPMVYPSHYITGNYGIPNPDKDPYKTVHRALLDAVKFLGPEQTPKLRPYLQDFSLMSRYGDKEVRAQIQAAADAGVKDWSLWNPRCVYTLSALTTNPSPPPTPTVNNPPLLEGNTLPKTPQVDAIPR